MPRLVATLNQGLGNVAERPGDPGSRGFILIDQPAAWSVVWETL